MRLIFAFLLMTVGGLAQTANQSSSPAVMGFLIPTINNATTFQLNAAANWYDQTFISQTAKTLNTVEVFCSAISGSLGSTDTDISLYTDTAGVPNTQTEHHGGQCTSNASLTVSGFSTALTVGVMNHLVVKNLNGTPASNNFTLVYTTNSTSAYSTPFFSNGNSQGTALWGNFIKTSANSGSTWTTSSSPSMSIILGYSDGTFDGFLISAGTRATSVGTGSRIFGKQEVGAVMSLPIHAKYNVIGIGAVVAKTSTPGNLQFRLYNGTTLVDTTVAIPAANITTGSTGDVYRGYFSSTHTVDCTAACSVRLTGQDATSGDTNSTGYNFGTLTIPNEATALSLKPMNGSMKLTLTTDDTVGPPATWTDTTTTVIPIWLILDSNGEYTALNIGGSQIAGKNQFIGPSRIQ